MITFLVILAILVCVLLALIVLIQNPKGGGLASGFSGSSNIMGVQRTSDFLEKGTWALAILIMALSLLINISAKGNAGTGKKDSKIQEQINKSNVPASSPSAIPLPKNETK